MKTISFLRFTFLFAVLLAGCTDHDIFQEPTQLQSQEFASGLMAPLGITHGNNFLWVTEQGNGSGKTGQVSAIGTDGKVYVAITGFTSVISPEMAPSGLTHLSYKDGKLYILHGPEGKLYIADVANYKPGIDPAMDAASLINEPIGAFVLSYDKFKIPKHESNLFNMTWGPDGDLYMTDAAANAIVHRKADKSLSIFTEFDPYETPGGKIDFVPTGIVYDGTKFLVTSLSGAPFIKGLATIKQVSTDGKTTSLFKDGFTTLVDIVLTPSYKPLVLSLAEFSLTTTPPGFVPMTGKVLNADKTVIADNMMMPTDLERTDDKTYYVVSLAFGKVFKLTY